MSEEIIGTDDVDIKLVVRPNGQYDFATKNGDLVPITSLELVRQRVEHRLKCRKRFYPQVSQEYINRDEILKQNVDEEGKSYYPGDLEEIGLPNYGSLLNYLIGYNDSSYIQGMLFMETAFAIGEEALYSGIHSIASMQIELSQRDTYNLILHLILKRGEQLQSTDMEIEL